MLTLEPVVLGSEGRWEVPKRSLAVPCVTRSTGLGGDVSGRLPTSLPMALLARGPLCCLSIPAEGHRGGWGRDRTWH